jgi:hypothetical protein
MKEPLGEKKSLMPLLALYQVMLKTKEEIIYNKTSVTKDLNLPRYLECFARGKLVKDRLKKSRPRSIGILNHILSLQKLYTAETLRPGQRSTSKKLTVDQKAQLIAKKKNLLKNSVVGETQKAMITQIQDGNFEQLALLANSLMFIKPRSKHQFMLHPPILIQLTEAELDHANFNREWVFKMAAKYPIKVVKPKGFDASEEVLYHMMLQTTFEDLDVLDWMVGKPFRQRQAWSKYNKKDEWDEKVVTLTTKYWTKPQRGAPRSTGITGRNVLLETTLVPYLGSHQDQ